MTSASAGVSDEKGGPVYHRTAQPNLNRYHETRDASCYQSPPRGSL